MESFLISYQELSAVHQAWIAAFICFLSTASGVLPAVLPIRLSDRVQDTVTGLSAGVMLGASFFSLILPGLAGLESTGTDPFNSALILSGAILAGAVILYFVHLLLPHEHFVTGREEGLKVKNNKLSRMWMFILAIGFHNFPEGIAVGIGTGTGDTSVSLPLMAAIAIQNFPEGMLVTLFVLAEGFSSVRAILLTVLTAVAEAAGVLAGFYAVEWTDWLLPYGLGTAAGAMLYVIVSEMIPETQQRGHEQAATAGIIAGFIFMILLDAGLA